MQNNTLLHTSIKSDGVTSLNEKREKVSLLSLFSTLEKGRY